MILKKLITKTLNLSLMYRCNNNKREILKTYLQIIPPKRIYQIVTKQENILDDFIKEKIPIQFPKIEKYLKKRINLIDLPMLTRLTQHLLSKVQDYNQYRSALRKIYQSVKYRAQNSKIQQLIDFVYILAKNNIRQPELMKQVQDAIIEQTLKIYYPTIRKVLWAYTHLDLGTALLYKHVCKTIKIGQHELDPLEIAQSAYMLSKVSDNALGGFGIFLLAEKHIQANLPRMDFKSLVDASSYLLSQNIGSNNFQLLLEQEIYKKYPTPNTLTNRDLTALLKSTSGYYFKFKQAALLSMLRSSTIKGAEHATLEQFEDILWSWGRSGKADNQTWIILQKQIEKRMKFLKPRQLAFFYFSLCSYSKCSTLLLKTLEQNFIKLELDKINQHFLIKFILGMHRRKDYDQKIFSQICKIISKKIQTLSNKQLLSFIKILNQSDIDFQNIHEFQNLKSSLIYIGQKILGRLYTLNITQIVQISYLWIKLQIQSSLKIQNLFEFITDINDIPKSVFIKAMFCYVMKDNYGRVLQMLKILNHLHRYGPIGYFFSPYDFPLLAYCLFHMAAKVQGNFQIDQEILKQVQESIEVINPVILNQFVKKGFKQAQNLIELYKKKKRD